MLANHRWAHIPNWTSFNKTPVPSYPHLCVWGKVVIHHLQHTLHDASKSPAYFVYLQYKFTWPTCPSQSIQWQILQLTLTRFKQSEQCMLTTFIHKWLVQDHYHAKSLSTDQLCLSWQGTTETVQHFLACPHIDQWPTTNLEGSTPCPPETCPLTWPQSFPPWPSCLQPLPGMPKYRNLSHWPQYTSLPPTLSWPTSTIGMETTLLQSVLHPIEHYLLEPPSTHQQYYAK